MDISPISILSIIPNLILRFGKLIISWFKHFFGFLSRRRAEKTLTQKLKFIISGFEDTLAESKACSLVYILRKIQNTSYSDICDEKMKRAYLLKEWYDFFKTRVETYNSRQIPDLIQEFIIILVRISNLAEETVKLIDQKMRLELKNDSNSWPLFKDIFYSATKDVSKLTREVEAKLIGIQVWTSVSLPDL